ncbi:MAG: PEP-CTERM sorting domain-containing protein [Pseudomonadota bacterium]
MRAATKAMVAGLTLAGTLTSLPGQCGLMAADNLQAMSAQNAPVAHVFTPSAPDDSLIALTLDHPPEPDFVSRAVPALDTHPLLYPAGDTASILPGSGTLRFGPMPEPGTLSLFGLGLLVWAFIQHRRR